MNDDYMRMFSACKTVGLRQLKELRTKVTLWLVVAYLPEARLS